MKQCRGGCSHEVVNVPTATSTSARQEADDRGTKSLSGGLEIQIEEVDANHNRFSCSDFMAFVEALRRVYRTDDEVNRMLGCEPGSPMDMLIKCYMSSTTKCQNKNSEESGEDSQTESDACDSQNQTSQERFKMRKQKMPRKACTFSEDEDYMEDCHEDVAALCTTASVLVQPMENGVANSFKHIDSGSFREQSNNQ